MCNINVNELYLCLSEYYTGLMTVWTDADCCVAMGNEELLLHRGIISKMQTKLDKNVPTRAFARQDDETHTFVRDIGFVHGLFVVMGEFLIA